MADTWYNPNLHPSERRKKSFTDRHPWFPWVAGGTGSVGAGGLYGYLSGQAPQPEVIPGVEFAPELKVGHDRVMQDYEAQHVTPHMDEVRRMLASEDPQDRQRVKNFFMQNFYDRESGEVIPMNRQEVAFLQDVMNDVKDDDMLNWGRKAANNMYSGYGRDRQGYFPNMNDRFDKRIFNQRVADDVSQSTTRKMGEPFDTAADGFHYYPVIAATDRTGQVQWRKMADSQTIRTPMDGLHEEFGKYSGNVHPTIVRGGLNRDFGMSMRAEDDAAYRQQFGLDRDAPVPAGAERMNRNIARAAAEEKLRWKQLPFQGGLVPYAGMRDELMVKHVLEPMYGGKEHRDAWLTGGVPRWQTQGTPTQAQVNNLLRLGAQHTAEGGNEDIIRKNADYLTNDANYLPDSVSSHFTAPLVEMAVRHFNQ